MDENAMTSDLRRRLRAIEEAEARGEPVTRVRWAADAAYLELQPHGVAVMEGTVEFVRPVVDGQPIPFDVTIEVAVVAGDRPRAAVQAVTVRSRAGGPAITSTGIHRAKLGRLMREAVSALSRDLNATARSARSLSLVAMSNPAPTRTDVRRAAKLKRLDEFVELHNEAKRKGVPYADYVAARATPGPASDPNAARISIPQVHWLMREARKAAETDPERFALL